MRRPAPIAARGIARREVAKRAQTVRLTECLPVFVSDAGKVAAVASIVKPLKLKVARLLQHELLEDWQRLHAGQAPQPIAPLAWEQQHEPSDSQSSLPQNRCALHVASRV